MLFLTDHYRIIGIIFVTQMNFDKNFNGFELPVLWPDKFHTG